MSGLPGRVSEAVPGILALLLVAAVLVRETIRRAPSADVQRLRRLDWAVHVLTPLVLVLLAFRLLTLN